MAFKNAGKAVTNAYVTYYTCPASKVALVMSCQVANVDGSNTAYVNGRWYDNSEAGAVRFAHLIDVVAGNAINILAKPLVLETGDYVQLQAEADSDLEATFSILEQDA